MKHSNLYFGLVLPSGGWQSLISIRSSWGLIQFFIASRASSLGNTRNASFCFSLGSMVASSSEFCQKYPKVCLGFVVAPSLVLWCKCPTGNSLPLSFGWGILAHCKYFLYVWGNTVWVSSLTWGSIGVYSEVMVVCYILIWSFLGLVFWAQGQVQF
jgi:hypothetical protein